MSTISVGQFLFWNLLPVTIGNLLAGAFFTGIALYATYPLAPIHIASQAPLSTAGQSEPQAAFAPAASLNPM